MVVDKPSGISSQSEGDGEPDLVGVLAAFDPGVRPVHRLDRPASGLVLFGRTQAAAAALSAQLQAGGIRRTYLAVLSCQPSAQVSRWDRPIDGEDAITEVDWLSTTDGLATARLRLQTGRFHQIRRHASAAGAPLLGDRRYGGEAGAWWPRLALHAWRLELTHPVTGQGLTWTAPIPTDLAQLWEMAGGPAAPA